MYSAEQIKNIFTQFGDKSNATIAKENKISLATIKKWEVLYQYFNECIAAISSNDLDLGFSILEKAKGQFLRNPIINELEAELNELKRKNPVKPSPVETETKKDDPTKEEKARNHELMIETGKNLSLLMKSKKYAEAEAIAIEFLEHQFKEPVFTQLVRIYNEQNEPSKALELFEKYSSSLKQTEPIRMLCYKTLTLAEDFEKIYKLLLFDNDSKYLGYFVTACINLDKVLDAERAVRELLNKKPGDIFLINELIRVLIGKGELEDAAEIAEFHLEKHPNDFYLTRKLIIIYLKLHSKNLEKAKALCESFLEKNPYKTAISDLYNTVLDLIKEPQVEQPKETTIEKSGTLDELSTLIYLLKSQGINKDQINEIINSYYSDNSRKIAVKTNDNLTAHIMNNVKNVKFEKEPLEYYADFSSILTMIKCKTYLEAEMKLLNDLAKDVSNRTIASFLIRVYIETGKIDKAEDLAREENYLHNIEVFFAFIKHYFGIKNFVRVRELLETAFDLFGYHERLINSYVWLLYYEDKIGEATKLANWYEKICPNNKNATILADKMNSISSNLLEKKGERDLRKNIDSKKSQAIQKELEAFYKMDSKEDKSSLVSFQYNCLKDAIKECSFEEAIIQVEGLIETTGYSPAIQLILIELYYEYDYREEAEFMVQSLLSSSDCDKSTTAILKQIILLLNNKKKNKEIQTNSLRKNTLALLNGYAK